MPAPLTSALPPTTDAAIIVNAPSASRFSDALLALLAPESTPTISMDDARALGWNDFLRLASGPAAATDGTVKPARAEKEEPAKDEGALSAEDLAALGVPGLQGAPVMVPTPEAAPAIDVAANGPAVEPRGLTNLRATHEAGGLKGDDKAIDLRATSNEKVVDTRDAHAASENFAAMLHAAQPATHEPKTLSVAIDAPPGAAAFREQTADTVRWMVRNGESRAEITVRPAELGPIQIELKIVQDVAQVVFVAAHPDTRDALQDHLPQLQELLAESGIQLGQASVQDQPSSSFAETAAGFAGLENGSDAQDAPLPSLATPLMAGNRLVDTFA